VALRNGLGGDRAVVVVVVAGVEEDDFDDVEGRVGKDDRRRLLAAAFVATANDAFAVDVSGKEDRRSMAEALFVAAAAAALLVVVVLVVLVGGHTGFGLVRITTGCTGGGTLVAASAIIENVTRLFFVDEFWFRVLPPAAFLGIGDSSSSSILAVMAASYG